MVSTTGSLSSVDLMYWWFSSVSASANISKMVSSEAMPRARRKVVAETLRLRSTLTDNISLALVSNSSQAPLEGISLA